MADISQFRFPTDIRFGIGARSCLGQFARAHGVKRPLLVTDPGFSKTKSFALILEQMASVWPDSFSKYTDVQANPTDADVDAVWQAYNQDSCDALVGVGGGSVLDATRAARLRVPFPKTPLQKVDFGALPGSLTPFCAIPTTAGTGSEVGRSSVITIRQLNRKVVLGANPLMADLAILDPELTVELPPHLTAATGMDAMSHAVESYVCPVFHPICDAIALEAIRIVRIYLPKAYANGNDLESRGMMQIAAAMGAIAFQKDLGAAHSMAHPLSTECGIQHGLANAIVLPSVVRFNGQEDSRIYDRVALALDLESGQNPAEEVARFLEDFNNSIGIQQKLSDLGVGQNDLPVLAKKAFEDGCHLTNPRTCTEQDFLSLFEQVF